jgi:antitoxin PrlF
MMRPDMATKDIEVGEATVTSKGQITVPGAVRKELGLTPGDRVRFIRGRDGSISIEARKRRSIIDIAREHPLPPGDYDVDKAIDEAMERRERRAGRRGER